MDNAPELLRLLVQALTLSQRPSIVGSISLATADCSALRASSRCTGRWDLASPRHDVSHLLRLSQSARERTLQSPYVGRMAQMLVPQQVKTAQNG
jgi:hypothetical protein